MTCCGVDLHLEATGSCWRVPRAWKVKPQTRSRCPDSNHSPNTNMQLVTLCGHLSLSILSCLSSKMRQVRLTAQSSAELDTKLLWPCKWVLSTRCCLGREAPGRAGGESGDSTVGALTSEGHHSSVQWRVLS